MKKILISAGLVAVLLLYVAWSHRNSTQETTKAVTLQHVAERDAPAEMTIPSSAPTAIATERSSMAAGINAFMSAANAQAAVEAQQRMTIGEPELAAEMAAELGDSCYRISMEGSLVARTSGNQWVLDKIKHYCTGYRSDVPATTLRKRALAMGTRVGVEKRLTDLQQNAGSEEAMKEAERIILNAEDPFSLDEARLYLARQPGGWVLGATMPEAALVGVNRATAQGLAAKLFECEAFGGCNANDLQTLAWCAQFEICQPG